MAKKKRRFSKVLITGATGSSASYLAEYIRKDYPEVDTHGITRWHYNSNLRNLELVRDSITLHECDLTDFSSIIPVLEKVKPDIIFHLASHTNVRASFSTPLAVIHNNVMGTANFLEAIRMFGIDPVIVLSSTSEVYGQVDPKNIPITEDCPLNPSSPYAVSKTALDHLGFTYFLAYGMKVIRTRMFTYINPRREDLFSTSFALQVARIEAGLQKELTHGNLDSLRTMIDVRDAMASMWLAAEKCEFGEVYNIGGGDEISVGEFLELLKNEANCPIPSKEDPKLVRPADVTLQIPDTTKFKKATGWKPKYSFEESIQYLMEHVRKLTR